MNQKKVEEKAYHGRCPICHRPLKQIYVDYMDGWCLMEEEVECPNKHYSLYYFTGNYLEHIGKREMLPLNGGKLYLWLFERSRWWFVLKEKIKWELSKWRCT